MLRALVGVAEEFLTSLGMKSVRAGKMPGMLMKLPGQRTSSRGTSPNVKNRGVAPTKQ
jgi:hypothetical protein